MKPPTREEGMRRLDVFIGDWTVEVWHPNLQPSPIMGHTNFEWLEEKYVVQRTRITKPEFPRSWIFYDWDADKGQYLQHYFDSRGVTRIYEMSFEDGIWKLWRVKPDFSPLDFHQRFSGEVKEGGNWIEGEWEQSEDGIDWAHDFRMVMKRA